MDDNRTDYRLWAICFAVFFLTPLLLLIGISLNARYLHSPILLIKEWACVTVFMAAVAAVFSWFVQSVIVGQGEWVRGRRPNSQDDDFADPPGL
ncbi:MAG TPA: hypothetical protein VHR66_24605 [Gemmataceae bacterium]|jgi:hypothetical protein|nr:hypothetical protein [Gemmataceae bacterium]